MYDEVAEWTTALVLMRITVEGSNPDHGRYLSGQATV